MISISGKCGGCLGQADEISPVPIPAIVPEFYNKLGEVWQALDQKCRESLPEGYCRQMLGYRPMIFNEQTQNPGGIKWYFFVALGFVVAKILR